MLRCVCSSCSPSPAALVWLVLTAAHEAAGIDIMPHGGLFQFPEVHWDKAGNLP